MAGGPITTLRRSAASPSALAGRWGRNGVRSVTQTGRWVLGMSLAVAALGLLRGDVWMYFIALVGLSAFAVSWCVVPRLPELEMRLVAPAVEVVGNLGKRGRIQESPVSQQSRVGKVQSLALTRQSALVHDLADQGVTEPVAV